MCKLINAGFLRLRKNKVFWFMVIISLITSAIILYRENKLPEQLKTIDEILIRKCVGNRLCLNSIHYTICWNRIFRQNN